MENKSSMSRAERLRREKVTRYSIRKYSFGAASVAVAALFMFLGNGAVSVQAAEVQGTQVTGKTDTQLEQDESKPATEVAPALNKIQLESYISEIETKLANGSYANKTDESVAVLKADLEAAKVALVNATTQDQITKAYNKLVNTANAGLRNKPVEKKETPAVDTTNGKETVGKKAANTEKKSDTNSIENTGSNDTRNGKVMDKDNAFRADTDTEKPTVEIPFSNGKDVYVYGAEAEGFDIKIKDNSGFITNATVKRGGNQSFNAATEPGKLNAQYGYTVNEITTKTEASESNPAVIHYTGVPGGELNASQLEAARTTGLTLGWRFVTATDEVGNFIENKASGPAVNTDPGSFNVIVKPQTYKYSIQQPESNADKISITDINNLTTTDIEKIKNQINIEYSKTSADARFESKKGEALKDKASVVKNIDIANGTITVTYQDDSVDTADVSSVARTNEKPTVEIEYSDPAPNKKEVYVYASEVNTFDIKIKDDSGKIASAVLKRGSNQSFKDVVGETDQVSVEYGFTANKISTETPATTDSPAVITYTGTPAAEGKFTQDKLEEVTRGENPPGIALGWRFVNAVDKDGADARGDGGTAADPTAFRVMLKPQTQKYDIQEVAEADKLPVVDASNVTEAEFNKIKEKVKLEYSKTNPDKKLESKRGQEVTDKDARIDTITRDGNDLVVTYKDGSVDRKPLTDFARTNVAPTVSIPYSDPAPNKKEVYLYTGEEADVDITFNDDSGKIKSASLRKGGNIALNNVGGNPDLQDNEWGFTVTAINSETATPAKIKVTGQVSGIAESRLPKTENDSLELVTRFATATDTDGAEISNNAVKNKNNGEIVGTYLTDPGAVTFVLKAQAKKYDIVTPTEEDKVAVADPTAVTDEEFAKIKAKLEYSRTNEDKNLESKRGEAVDNTDNKVATITKEGNNIVATYKDGSKDVRPLSDFTKLDKQPAIDAVNTASTEKIAAINSTPNATDEEKAAAVAKVNADKEKALTAINDATAKDALDKAKESGTTAIAADNPVVTKKDAAKADVEAARKAKEDAIKADTNLTQAEKDAAIAKNNTAAAEATKAIDTATTNDAVDQAKTAGTTAIGKVNPVAKENAKEAIANALTDKNSEINKRTDLSDAEKTAAKAEAQKLADAELAKITAQPDNADTPEAAAAAQKIVNDAEDKGVADVTSVNPVAKEAAKKAVADELTKKEEQIDARTDLTKEEKDAAKKEAQDKAKEATDAIDAQPSITDSADKATAAQTAVDGAKDKGVADVKAVDPVAAKKPAAKKAVEDALKDKVAAIDARADLTPEEKQTAKEKAAEEAKKATDAIDAATTDAAVDTAKTAGTGEIAKVNPVAKTKAKDEIAKELADKEKAIDARTDLTDKEKAVAKEDAKAKAKEATDAINAQPDNAETPEKAAEAQTAVDGAKDKGVADVKAVDPVAAKKPAAKKAIDDALTAKNNEIDARTDLTPEEKTKAKEIAKAKAAAAKDAVDKATTNAEVDKVKTDGTTAVANVTPVAKEAAKTAIADALTAKNKEIDARTDLTDEEKTAAKKEAKDKADAQLAEIAKQPDAADTPEAAKTAQDAVDAAKKTGVADVTAVNPAAVKKTEAKQAIDDALTAKNNAIDARTDLTDAEKKAAKDKAAEEAKKAKEAIDAATTDASVDTVTTAGLDEIAKVNPVAKEAAKKAVADELAKKEAEIDARTDLSDAEKAAAKKDAQAKAKEATDAINAQPDNAETPEAATAAQTAVDNAKDKGVADVKSVNPVAKEVAKKAVADELAKKEAEIDARTDLTKEEKDAAKKDAQDKAKSATDAINAQPDNADTPEKAAEAQKAVDTAKKTGVDEVAAVNPEAVTKPAAKKAIDDKLAEQLKAIENTPDATDEEKKVAADAAKALAEEAKKAIDKAGTDAEVKQLQDEAKKEIEKSVPVVEDKPNARKAIDDEATAKKAAIDARDDLTPKAKEDLKAQVDKIAEQAKKSVDAAKTAEAVDGIEESDKAAIKAVGEVNIPADKVLVNDPSTLTDDEKAKVLEAVKKVNPDAKEITQDADGNITVTTPDGHQEIITPEQVVKTADTANDPKAGNDVVKPADKVVVNDPAKLTDAEKEKIKAAVEAVNPNSVVTVDEKGNAKVSTPDGQTQVIPVEELVRTVEDTKKPNAGNDIVKPADKTVVANPDALTPEEKKAIEDKVKAVNPGSTVVVDDKGNATVTTPAGKTAVIPSTDLTKSAADAAKPNAGNDIVKPADKTVVANPDALTPEEKKAIEDKVKAVNPGATVVVDENGNATVTTPEGKTATIPAAQLVKDAKDVAAKNNGENINVDFEKETVADFNNLTDAEKEAAKAKIKGANADVVEVIFDKAGNATVITKDGKVYTIVAKDIFKQRPYVPSNGGSNNSGNGNGTSDNNGATNTDVKADKAKLEGAIHQLDELIIKESANLDAETAKEANDLLADAKKVFANADASQAEVDAMVKRIEDFMAKVAPSTDHATPATTQAAANASQTASAQANTRTVAKELPNTGTADSVVSMVAAAASAVLGLGLAGRRRKEDEEA